MAKSVMALLAPQFTAAVPMPTPANAPTAMAAMVFFSIEKPLSRFFLSAYQRILN